jgi:four helix bundle protein
VSKLSDAESEATETQVWLEFAVQCGYMPREDAKLLYQTYHTVLGTIVGMINHPETWLISEQDKTIREEDEDYNELF